MSRPGESALSEGGLIRGKLSPGRLPSGVVSRPALLERLSGGDHRALTLLSAPAGFGKTTLVTAWAAELTSVAWVSLDRRDTDPARFWTHVIAALAATEPRAGTTSLAAVRAHPEEIEQYALPKLLEELLRDGPGLALVLDDYHLAETAQINGTVEAFMRYRPARIQLVISTRSDPALGVARLRASGELVELRAGDLRFDERELAAFLEGMGVEGLSEEEQKSLAERTGGWPAPLRLLALLIPGRDRAALPRLADPRQPARGGLPRHGRARSPSTRGPGSFVLRASVLGRMNAALCDAVVGTPGSGAILADLERSNLFMSVDDSGEWYQLHHLFAEALRLELARTQPALVPGLHLRAAAWFEQAGDLETATAHAIASKRPRRGHPAGGAPGRRSWPVGDGGPPSAAGCRSSRGRRRWLTPSSRSSAPRGPASSTTWTSPSSGSTSQPPVPLTWSASMGLPLGYRTDFLRAIVGVNDVDRAESAARRAIESAPAPHWEGVALAGLGQAQYLQGRVRPGSGHPPWCRRSHSGCESEPADVGDRKPGARGVRRGVGLPCRRVAG